MPTRRELLGAVPLFAVIGCLGDRSRGTGGTTRSATAPATSARRTTTADVGTDDAGAVPSVSSPAFDAGEAVPPVYTCDGDDVSPPLRFRGVSSDTASIAVFVDDPDAPSETPFVHWLLWNVPPETIEIPEGVPNEPTVSSLGGAAQGRNDFGDIGYRGPCPPSDDGPHTYRFRLLLLDATLDVDPGAGPETLRGAIDPHLLGEAVLTATYER